MLFTQDTGHVTTPPFSGLSYPHFLEGQIRCRIRGSPPPLVWYLPMPRICIVRREIGGRGYP